MGEQFSMFDSYGFNPEDQNGQKKRIPTGKELRDEGINKAVNHADLRVPNWSIKALKYVIEYAKKNMFFTCEDVRIQSRKDNFPQPPDGRAWGGIISKARQREFIIRTRETRSAKIASNHAGPCRIWQSKIIN